jgi:hypothetical protein
VVWTAVFVAVLVLMLLSHFRDAKRANRAKASFDTELQPTIDVADRRFKQRYGRESTGLINLKTGNGVLKQKGR